MRYINKTSITLMLVAVIGYLSMYNSSGSYATNGGRTGAPFDNGTCSSGGTSCHGTSGSWSPTTTIQLLDGTTPVTSYTSNKSYTVKITISASGTTSSNRYGFQAVCVQSSTNNEINNWPSSMPSGTKKLSPKINNRTYISHSTRLTSGVISVPWTSPATTTGNITFYAAGLVADGNNQQTNDNVATTSLTITPSTGGGCTKPTVNASPTHVNCYGDFTGAISINTTGGSTPFSYDWTGPNSFSSNAKNITNLVAGQYRLVLTANGGCKDTTYVTINQPATPIKANLAFSTPLCAGDNIALSSSASGGNAGSYSYGWTGPAGASSTTSTLLVPNATPANSGQYIVTVKDAKNCTIKDTANIQVDSMPQVDGITADMITNNTFKFNMLNPRFVNSKIWLYGDGKSDTLASPNHTYTANGTYDVMLILSNHCGSDTFTTSVNVWPQSVSTVASENNIRISPNPATTNLNINAAVKVNSVSIYSISGAVVLKQTNVDSKHLNIDVSKIANGQYFLHIATDNMNKTTPLVIQH
ncbi:MAG: T9SS type A sorting domain-containing protein [Chitinophagaceae bacterium]|nr:T9SS type A sorting domain-containing protein [Chitinophagaceae bacterium]